MSALLTRRGLLQSGSALAAWNMIPRAALAGSRDPRFLFVILRGALDGLALAPPIGDPSYVALRRDLVFPIAGDGAALPLDGFFGPNPNMPIVKAMYDEGQAAVLHAVATGYRERSHFDGQDVLENGTPTPNGSDTGWLNRTAGLIPSVAPANGRDLFAVGTTVPLVMRGPAPVVTWSPGALKGAQADTVTRLMHLYQGRDDELLNALIEGEKLDALFDGKSGRPVQPPSGMLEARVFVTAAQAAGRMLARPDGPRVAALALDGWDTHANEGPGSGRLGRLLGGLDQAFGALRTELGSEWSDTVVVVATEFGRTVRENGTTGTDHGTGAAALMLGGAVKGGRVIADWPGLQDAALFEGRDLKPTLDLRAVLKGVLADHLGVPLRQLDATVFPGSEGVTPLQGLLA